MTRASPSAPPGRESGHSSPAASPAARPAPQWPGLSPSRSAEKTNGWDGNKLSILVLYLYDILYDGYSIVYEWWQTMYFLFIIFVGLLYHLFESFWWFRPMFHNWGILRCSPLRNKALPPSPRCWSSRPCEGRAPHWSSPVELRKPNRSCCFTKTQRRFESVHQQKERLNITELDP